MKNFKHILLALAAAIILQACAPADGEFTGNEYMPDMGHSIAYEANVLNYYYLNTWDDESTFKLKELSNPGLPVAGTIPRGYAGIFFSDSTGHAASDVMDHLQGGGSINAISVPVNGSSPYYYEDTEEERTRATAEIIANPFPITEAGLIKGGELYNIYCGICHGEKGDGGGFLVRDADPAKGDAGGVYPAAPANFLLDDFVNASNGRYYHSIIYGKNVMGGYADKLSYEERWQVIHYIRSLQAKEKKLIYTAEVNTLNAAFGIPASQIKVLAEQLEANEPAHEEEGGHDQDTDGTHDDHNDSEHH